MDKRKVIGERPTSVEATRIQTNGQPTHGQATIPTDWVICNAPRPIVGHVEWTGNFVSGVFYAAIDPDGDRASWMLKENTGLHAVELEYVTLPTVSEMHKWLTEFYQREYAGEVSDEEIADLNDREIESAYLANQNTLEHKVTVL